MSRQRLVSGRECFVQKAIPGIARRDGAVSGGAMRPGLVGSQVKREGSKNAIEASLVPKLSFLAQIQTRFGSMHVAAAG